MNLTKTGLRRAVAVGATVGTLAVGIGAGVGSANASAPAATARATLAARAHAAGLTSGAISTTQQQVDSFIAVNGGSQVALNQVKFAGGTATFGVPGATEQAAKDGVVVPFDTSCSYYHFCGWKYDNYSGSGSAGSKIDLVSCGSYTAISWGSGGSWKNNQSTGTVARMYDSNHNEIYHTPGAYSSDAHANWLPVYYVKPC